MGSLIDAGEGCTEFLLHEVLDPEHTRIAISERLDPTATLIRSGLVSLTDDRARPFARLRPHRGVIERLRAAPSLWLNDSVRIVGWKSVQSEPTGAEAALTERLTRGPASELRIEIVDAHDANTEQLVIDACARSGRGIAFIEPVLAGELHDTVLHTWALGLAPVIVKPGDSAPAIRHQLAAVPLPVVVLGSSADVAVLGEAARYVVSR